jgi:DUF4097 and DUF4098 domain-containing protein YvlB
MSCRVKAGVAVVALVLGAGTGNAQDWSFSGVERIEIRGVSGDVEVRPAADAKITVKLVAQVSPEDAFEPRVEQNASTLRIDERWHGDSSGSVRWTLLVPAKAAGLRIRMNTASGDLEVEGIAARIDLETASGDISLRKAELGASSEFRTASGTFTFLDATLGEDCEIKTASGDIKFTGVTLGSDCEVSTASGDIEVVDCKGKMAMSSASGDVMVKKCDIADRGDFSTASGDVSVQLAKLPSGELEATSASGDVSLDVANYGDNFTLTLVKRQDRGRIVCPFDFASERTYEDQHVYEEKIVKHGTGGPEVLLKTASGSVTVHK